MQKQCINLAPHVLERVKKLKKEYLALVKFFRGLGYHKPEHKAESPKWKAYRLLREHGISINEAVRIFKEVDPHE